MVAMGDAKRWIQSQVKGVLRRMPRTRMAIRQARWDINRERYVRLAARVRTDARCILFDSFMGRSVACSPKAIYEAICADARFNGYELWWALLPEAAARHEGDPLLSRAHVVDRTSADYRRLMARAGTIFTNSMTDAAIIPKSDQTYVQCWHGTPLKRLGLSIDIEQRGITTQENTMRYGIEAAKMSYLLSPSAYTTQHLSDAFGFTPDERAAKVLQLGYPRNDRVARACADDALMATERARILRDLGIAADDGRRLLLYAPTFRESDYKPGVGYVMDALVDFDELRRALGDGWQVLFRPHYFVAQSFDFSRYGDFVVNAADVEDVNDLYLAADALLTDYSSVFYDYSVTGRPILFFWPDFDTYRDELRGFYADPHGLPGPKCQTTAQVADALAGIDSWQDTYGDAYAAFRQTYVPLDDGYAAERVVARLFGDA